MAIGTGAFSKVYSGTWKGQKVAVKRINEGKTVSTVFLEYRNEILIHSSLSHPIYGISMNPFCLVLEYLSCGTLQRFLAETFHCSGAMKARIATDIAKALEYMHGLNPPVAHLDLKSPNILLCDKFVTTQTGSIIKLIDFGCSQPIISPLTNFTVDNPIWAAPEMILEKPLTEKADVYSFAIVCWEIVTQTVPYKEYNFFNQIGVAVSEGKRPPIPAECPLDWREIIIGCWEQEPECRRPWKWVISTLDQIEKSVRLHGGSESTSLEDS